MAGGLADLDVAGSGEPAGAAALAALGITEDERRELATLYAPGQSLWRVPIPHFTPWDCNWPYGPPDDAQAPPDPLDPNEDPEPEDDPNCQQGSIIECENQILGESVPIAGTPFRLHYRSDRAVGRRVANRLNIVLSRNTVPASLRRIELIVEVAGRQYRQSFPAVPNLSTTFEWDRRDGYGRVLNGRFPATVHVGYVYGGVYYSPADFERSFAAFSSEVVALSDRSRQEVTLWRSHSRAVGLWDARGQELGGWTLDVHHAYDPNHPALLLGDGTRRTDRGAESLVTQGVQLRFDTARTDDVAVDADGGAVATDLVFRFFGFFDYYISRRRPDGTLLTRRAALVDAVSGIGLGRAEEVYYAQCLTQSGFKLPRLLKLSADGTVTELLREPQLDCPTDVVMDRDGSLLIADSGLQRILRLTPDGALSTVAGSGDPQAGDSGPALAVRLQGPSRLALGPDGTIYYTEHLLFRIRRIGADGLVSTVAGTGLRGFTPDGAPAATSRLDS
ncbi:MAG: RHS repeat-associated core domain-containing protein, partial [Gemmatimonadales bacterium]